jgi:lysine-specific demethylase/histidyl-hydroxylase NO66
VVNPRRDDLIGAFNELAQAVMRRLPLDAAADAIGAGFMRQRLPPPPSHVSAPVAASGPDAAGTVTDACVVRVTQEEGARLVVEDDAVIVCHPFANGRLLHMEGGDDENDIEIVITDGDGTEGEGGGVNVTEGEPQDAPGTISFDLAHGPTLEHLLFDEECVERGVVVKDLPLPKEDRVELARRLVEAGVLAVVG